ncbi:MAG: rod shape-determining protein MreD [Candidatus Schekmanbacteria bacterium]|nr:rod shape-determining protein MreD [Candidatus Schekmanbacteria bacterium]
MAWTKERVFLFMGIFAAAALWQTSIFNPLKIWHIVPDLFLIIVVYFNLFGLNSQGMWCALGAGLLEDTLSGSPLGQAALSKVLAACATILLGNQMVPDNPVVQSLLVFTISILESTFRLFLIVNFSESISFGWDITWRLILPQAFFTALITPIVFWLMGKGAKLMDNG